MPLSSKQTDNEASVNKTLKKRECDSAGPKLDTTALSPMVFPLPKSKAESYPNNRANAFKSICGCLKESVAFQSTETAIAHGDSLSLLKCLPSSSIDLVLTDPPYHSTKKQNIYGDADFSDDSAFIDWISEYVEEWYRVLKPNGSLYLFCSSDMAPYLYVAMSRRMNMHGTVTWTKPNEPGYDGWKQKMKKTALRRWYPHSERIIFCSPAFDGNLKRSPFGMFLRSCRQLCNLTSHQLTELTGSYGRINNGGAVSNWETGRNIPSREQYKRICEALIATRAIEHMPAYEDVIRAFAVDPSRPFIDVWDFMNVRQYRGKHPAEKPLDMLRHMITTSSYPSDIVLDCFSGSGSTSVAAQETGRHSIGIEIEDKWVDYSVHRLKTRISTGVPIADSAIDPPSNTDDLPLFSK